jgi:hypothetical protein
MEIAQPKQTKCLRQVFCGDNAQHELIIASTKKLLHQPEAKAIVIGGTYLTGKSTLLQRIMYETGLIPYNSYRQSDVPIAKLYVSHRVGFSDMDGRPRTVMPKDLYDSEVNNALNKGVRIVFLDEASIGNKQDIQFVTNELVKKWRCKIVFDIVSGREGKGFFDANTNNLAIRDFLNSILEQNMLSLYLLNFNIQALREGVLAVAKETGKDFMEAFVPFPREERTLLYQARLYGKLQEELDNILGFPIQRDIERY